MAFAEVHDELRAVARELLAEPGRGGEADWKLLAASGWTGLDVPEALDGGGATVAEVSVILEELGRAATRSPYLGSVVLGAGTLALVAPGERRDELLRGVASGGTVLAAALAGESDAAEPGEPPFRLERSGGTGRVHGRAAFVPDAPAADRLLLLAHEPGTGPVVVELGAGAEGVAVADQPVLDATRRLGLVRAEGAEVGEASILRFEGAPERAVQSLFDRAAVALACDSLGLSEAMLEATVAYAGARHQFGRPIGSFQAVKHACADLFVATSMARELVGSAVARLAGGDPEATAAAAMAKAYACDAAVEVAGKAMQLHGGIGYTWESDVHVYLKRATLDRALFGAPAAHRRRLARRYA